MKWVIERHHYWWDYLLKRVWVPDEFDQSVPPIKWNTRASRTAGRANNKTCEYNVNYILQEQGAYDETICHEVCHVFAKRLIKFSTHDTLWEYLFNVVCKAQRGKYHNYKIVTKQNQTKEAKMVAELLKLQKKLSSCRNGA